MRSATRLLASFAFRASLLAFPRSFRRANGDEMRVSFDRALEGTLEREGFASTVRLTASATVDALRQGWTERLRDGVPPGHGRPAGQRGTGAGVLRGLGTDLRLAGRTLLRSPGFTAAAVLILGLGIGVNTTVFSALRAALLAEPPYPDLDRLVLADLTVVRPGRSEVEVMPWSFPKFRTFQEARGRLIDPVAGYASRPATLSEPGPPSRIDVEVVSPGYFGILGMDPVIGRAFSASEENPADAPLVAVLSYGIWQGRFSGDPSILDRSLTLNGHRFSILGVAPPGFRGLSGTAELWLPVAATGQVMNRFMLQGAQAHWMHVVGRLRAGARFEDARAQMTVLGDVVAEAHPASEASNRYSASARRFEDVRVNESARSAVLLLSAAAALVLLVACANLSGLLLARARRRARERAVRLAVGASRWRLVRSSLVESAILAGAGGVLGVLLSIGGTRGMSAAWPDQFLGSVSGEMRVMSVESLGTDGVVLGFGVLATVLTTLLFGLAPALRASRSDLSLQMSSGGGASRRTDRVLGVDLRAVLVGGQVALALTLLVGTALVGVSMRRLLEVDVGFDPSDLLTFDYSVARESAWAQDPLAFHQELLERVRALPGVTAATVGTPPFGGHWGITVVHEIEGRAPYAPGEQPAIGINIVAPGYFEVMGIPLSQGRTFNESDGADATPTIVLNRLAAKMLFPQEEAVGRRLRLGVSDDGKEAFSVVVGVVQDALYEPPDQDAIPEAYYAMREFPLTNGTLSVRTAREPLALVPAVRSALLELDPTTPMFGVTTMDARMADATGDRRVVLSLLGLFALVTVLLAATGTWGIVGYAVADRRRELGLRMALGAGHRRVLRMVLRQSFSAALAGVAAGLGAAWAGGRLLDTFLYRTSPRDPGAFLTGAALLLTVVLVASYLPARRATRLDLVETLKAE